MGANDPQESGRGGTSSAALAAQPWTPSSGTPSPGAPPYQLSTVSRAAGTCYLTYGRGWLAYDSADKSFWVATAPNCVDVITANFSSLRSITVGSDPFGVAVDSRTGDVFVTNTGSNNVTVINGSSLAPVAAIRVGSSPLGAAFDPVTGEVYVANSGSNNVSVINGTTLQVVASVPVGSGPFGVTADGAERQVFVANNGSSNVSVISDATHTVIANPPAGAGPEGIALDNTSGLVFVANAGSSNVTVLNASGDYPVATIPVVAPGLVLQGAAYDAKTRTVWIAAGVGYIVVLNATALAVSGYWATDPSGVAYDPDTGEMCVTETGNNSFACLRYAFGTVSLTFAETGLPSGTSWTVGLPNGAETTTAPNDTFGIIPYVYPPAQSYSISYKIPPARGFTAQPSNGTASVDSAGVVVNVAFARSPGLFLVEFRERGLPAGASWAVDLNGTVNRSTSPTNSFWEPNGTAYAFRVQPPVGFSPGPASGSVGVNGSLVRLLISFRPGPSYAVEFNETGLPSGYSWTAQLNGVWEVGIGSSIRFALANGSYPFQVRPVATYSPTPGSGSLRVAGSAVTVPIVFAPPSTFTVTFAETGLPGGSWWAVNLSGTTLAAATTRLGIAVPNGSYSFAVTGPIGFSASPDRGPVSVLGTDLSEAILFQAIPIPLWANFSYQIQYASCLPSGGVTNYVLLNATAGGGTSPYTFSWILPTGSPTGALTDTTTTYGQNNAATLTANDSSGHSMARSMALGMELPPCPPPGLRSTLGPALSFDTWLIVGLAGALVVVSGASVWLGLRRRGGPGRDPPPPG